MYGHTVSSFKLDLVILVRWLRLLVTLVSYHFFLGFERDTADFNM
jgi:hypothetical protein